MNYTYILRCCDGTYYTGWTNDLEKRLRAHGEGRGAKYTRSRTPVELVYFEEFETKSEAMRREAAIKRMTRREKEMLAGAGKQVREETLAGVGKQVREETLAGVGKQVREETLAGAGRQTRVEALAGTGQQTRVEALAGAGKRAREEKEGRETGVTEERETE